MTAPPLPPVRSALVTTDLSEFGNRAVSWAYAVVAPGGVVHLMHVIEPVHVPNPLYAHYTPGKAPTADERAIQRRAIEEQLRALVPVGAKEKAVETLVAVSEDDEVARSICEAAAARDVDLVCMSSHGRSGLSKVLLGSVAERVLEHCKRPLFVVPPSARVAGLAEGDRPERS